MGDKLAEKLEALPEIVEQNSQKILDFGSVIDAKLAEFGEKINPVEVKSKAELEAEAELHIGALEGISKMQVWDIPLGQAVVGGFSSVLVSELIDGFFAKQSVSVQGVVKLAVAGATIKWGSKILGKTGAIAMAILLTYDGVRQLLPIDEYAGKVSGAVVARTGGGLAGKAGMGDTGGNGHRQTDYYEALKGGA